MKIACDPEGIEKMTAVQAQRWASTKRAAWTDPMPAPDADMNSTAEHQCVEVCLPAAAQDGGTDVGKVEQAGDGELQSRLQLAEPAVRSSAFCLADVRSQKSLRGVSSRRCGASPSCIVLL